MMDQVVKNYASTFLTIKEGTMSGSEEETKERRTMGGIGREDAHLALKVLHYIQEMVVHVRFIVKLHLDRVQVAQRVRHIERPISPIAVALSSVGSSNSGVPTTATVFRLHRLGLGGRCARAGARRRAGERVVRTQPGRRWWGEWRLS